MGQLLSPVAMFIATSMGATVNSSGFPISRCASLSVQPVWSAGSTPVGTLKLQGSNDNIIWNDLPDTSATGSVSGNTGSLLLTVPVVSVNWVRLVYTRTSGTATLDAQLYGKL